jgi:hypothetical protein
MPRKPRLRRFDFDADKFKELIVYVAERCDDDPSFGAVKLNKILYYADFDAYRVLGEPISGATYRKFSEGPAPKELVQARTELIEHGRLQMEERSYFNRTQKRLVLTHGTVSNPEVFSVDERQVVDQVIQFFWGKSAREVSDYSHREPGWLAAGERERIPYETAGLSPEPIDQETEEFAMKIAREYIAKKHQGR